MSKSRKTSLEYREECPKDYQDYRTFPLADDILYSVKERDESEFY